MNRQLISPSLGRVCHSGHVLDSVPAPLPGATVQLVIFDLMGTLVADDGIVDRAYAAALGEAGLEGGSDAHASAMETVRANVGRPTLDVLIAALDDPVTAEEATWAFDDSVLADAAQLAEIPGASDTLQTLAADGVLLAVTTSFTPEVRKAVLAHLGWSERFAMTLSAHGVRRGHPAPDLLLEAILELRIDSVSQVAIVGDNVADLEAGNRAGAGLVVGVRSGGAGAAQLAGSPHTHLIDSVADLPSVLVAPRTAGQRRASDR